MVRAPQLFNRSFEENNKLTAEWACEIQERLEGSDLERQALDAVLAKHGLTAADMEAKNYHNR
ncbi:hypothetical protein [Bifidobacterium callitrichidarum]|uniref:Uncharacterized protein n=1 Tax=Bifidobacterium callitrichidarum TaxID=2052941 RepID=A0A2U2NCE4_9BIFI|nr:hypothetical protein [Bifidobacterium callitrichidarum]PWG66758.1 hypothetical protein DF196_02315 [Bifidobacterium callitrichidarum]